MYKAIVGLHRLLFLTIIGWFAFFPASAQDNLDLNKRIGEVDSTNIFSSPEFYTWCSRVIKGEDGKYHMFYSRWGMVTFKPGRAP